MVMVMMCVGCAHAQSPASRTKLEQPVSSTLPASDPVEVKLVRNRVVLVDGKEIRQHAAVAKPGDVLEEIATYTNKSKSPIRQLEATLPIPPNTELLLASVRPGSAKGSVDGSNFSVMPLVRKVKNSNGVETEQAVPLSEYRYLRWYVAELGAEKTLAFSARFKVSNDSSATETTKQK